MKQLNSILTSSIGNILEWYDFGLFTIFSPVFSQIFFPTQDPQAGLIATLSIFAIGFICRPFGGLLFGYLGDKLGRAVTLRLSILMISIPTFLIGCLPTYQQIGVFAPFLLMIIRMWQGISIGGEFSGNLIYLAESAPQHRRAVITSFASMGANIGILIAAIIGIFCTIIFKTDNELQNWGWRIPYLLSGFLSLLIYFTRLQIQETKVFNYLKEKKRLVKNPIKTAFKKNHLQMLRTLGLVCMGATFYYFCLIYIPVFLTKNLQVSMHTVSIFISISIFVMILITPLAGFLCDNVGRRKMLLFNASIIMISVIPAFYFLQMNHLFTLIFILLFFTIACSLEQGTTSISVVENFPPPARFTGISLSYNIGNGCLGGTVPIVCEWLLTNTHSQLAPALYIAICAFITWLVVYFFVPETQSINLSQE